MAVVVGVDGDCSRYSIVAAIELFDCFTANSLLLTPYKHTNLTNEGFVREK
jgi:hypothetical protein